MTDFDNKTIAFAATYHEKADEINAVVSLANTNSTPPEQVVFDPRPKRFSERGLNPRPSACRADVFYCFFLCIRYLLGFIPMSDE